MLVAFLSATLMRNFMIARARPLVHEMEVLKRIGRKFLNAKTKHQISRNRKKRLHSAHRKERRNSKGNHKGLGRTVRGKQVFLSQLPLLSSSPSPAKPRKKLSILNGLSGIEIVCSIRRYFDNFIIKNGTSAKDKLSFLEDVSCENIDLRMIPLQISFHLSRI